MKLLSTSPGSTAGTLMPVNVSSRTQTATWLDKTTTVSQQGPNYLIEAKRCYGFDSERVCVKPCDFRELTTTQQHTARTGQIMGKRIRKILDRPPPSQSKPRHELKLLSWNVNDIRNQHEGCKTELQDFAQILSKHDIFCLQETKHVVSLPNYRCFNSNRTDSRSGGVCIGVSKQISSGVQKVDISPTNDIIVIKLKGSFFNLNRDTYIINVYNSPINSSYKKRKARELIESEPNTTLDDLAECISNIPADIDIVVAGDFNARTGYLDDLFISMNHDMDNLNLDVNFRGYQKDDPPVDIPSRSNCDCKVNAEGKPFIELTTSLGLIILNGRTLGDSLGNFTCTKYNGSSTIDYICTSEKLFGDIRYLKVGDQTIHSDHKPLSCALQLHSKLEYLIDPASFAFQDAPRPVKWNKDVSSVGSSTKFKRAQEALEITDKIDGLLNQSLCSKDDVYSLNESIATLVTDLARCTTRQSYVKRTNKKSWFDWDCRRKKREVCKLAKLIDKQPNIDVIRLDYYTKKKEYKALLKSKREEYLLNMNSKINQRNGINWKALKQLKEQTKDQDSFDVYDLQCFYKFFDNLYGTKCKSSHGNDTFIHRHSDTNVSGEEIEESLEQLNQDFTIDELNAAINKIKNNKSVSTDLISNEMIKNSLKDLRELYLKMFNGCLQLGVYPWNLSLTTPLHKKGDRYNPDNYRAITVGSCLGKLFSTMLLDRLVTFRKLRCPDYPNQLGFKSGAQCSDHILTLKTIIDKYVSDKRGRLYTCFIDYRKAFDTVCRQALLFKVSNLGISGRFFSCVKHMYSNSSIRIKLIQKVSAAIDVSVGTEQGQPMSPELFKMFIYDLSTEIESLVDLALPNLNGFNISHLLWADDLILLALDEVSLQKLLNLLHEFVQRWELSINISKTNIMVFNRSSRILNCSYGFHIGDAAIQPVKNYCYLGILFSLNGSFKANMDQLSKKALRSYFSIKRTIDTRALTTKSLLKLMDCLVTPVATYACQIWLPSTFLLKGLTDGCISNLTTLAGKDKLETTHLRMLKWILGVHKKASNNFCYGDTGRLPLGLSMIPQCIQYFNRASSTTSDSDNLLLYHTFQEQKSNNMEWYNTWKSVLELDQLDLAGRIRVMFVKQWKANISTSSKLRFYNSIKPEFGEEPYLELHKKTTRDAIARLRSSSHDLNIERGRYKPGSSLMDRLCRFCCLNDTAASDFLQGLEYLPFFDPIVETEHHVLTVCPAYHHLRIGLSDTTKSLLMRNDYGDVMQRPALLNEFGDFLCRSYSCRHPKSKDDKSKENKSKDNKSKGNKSKDNKPKDKKSKDNKRQ